MGAFDMVLSREVVLLCHRFPVESFQLSADRTLGSPHALHGVPFRAKRGISIGKDGGVRHGTAIGKEIDARNESRHTAASGEQSGKALTHLDGCEDEMSHVWVGGTRGPWQKGHGVNPVTN
jgi:hypothetical protein